MRTPLILFFLATIFFQAHAQVDSFELHQGWEFRKAGTKKWTKASVPGTVHTDLMANGMIPDPFYRDNEPKVQWVEETTWEYRTTFSLPAGFSSQKKIRIEFDGLDTEAEVFLNGTRIIAANNMFRQWTADVKSLLRSKKNVLLVRFFPTAKKAMDAKRDQKIEYPDNERAFVRKAQYQFGWDWGPRLVTCGIWKPVRLITGEKQNFPESPSPLKYGLTVQKDSIGEAFYFTQNGKPVFIRGANWIPADNFLHRTEKEGRYEQLIKAAKEANINMLRVWGGGIYEDDVFYELCDKYGIMVWQDFMFAGALYPGDADFLQNVEAEVRYQVERLRHHPCIALWCGNNEIEEAWFNWGWQKQFQYSDADSLKLWNDYRKIFHDLIPNILKELDPERPYWPSSPSLGWGRDSAYKKGDVHYWGVWWGREPIERYNEKAGRFVSEYGMQGMPDIKTIRQFATESDLDTSSAVMKIHQKHPFGWENIRFYIEQRFPLPNNFEDLVYTSQLMQADAMKTAIEAHRKNYPVTMGTMFWQWNDCWPVTSWSAIDYFGRKKALFYEVKRSYADVIATVWKEGDLYLTKIIYHDSAHWQGKKLWCTHRSFDGWRARPVTAKTHGQSTDTLRVRFMDGLEPQNSYLELAIQDSTDKIEQRFFYFFLPPKDLNLKKPYFTFTVNDDQTIGIQSDAFAYGVYLDVPDEVELEENFFHLIPHFTKEIRFRSALPVEKIREVIRVKSLADTF